MATVTHEGSPKSELTEKYAESLNALVDALMNSRLGLGKEYKMASLTTNPTISGEMATIEKQRKIPLANGYSVDYRFVVETIVPNGPEKKKDVWINVLKGEELVLGFKLDKEGLARLNFAPILFFGEAEVKLENISIGEHGEAKLSFPYDRDYPDKRNQFRLLGPKLAELIIDSLETGELARVPNIGMNIPALTQINAEFQERADAAKSLDA